MKELKILESKINVRLKEIIKSGDEGKQTTKERYEYITLQQRLKELHNIMYMLEKMKIGG